MANENNINPDQATQDDQVIDEVRRLIAQAQLKEALEKLGELERFRETADSLINQLKRIDKANTDGLIPREQLNNEYANLTIDTLRILRGERPRLQPTQPAPADWPNLKRLMHKVENNYVKNVYEARLQNSPQIALRLTPEYDFVDHPWKDVVSPPQFPDNVEITRIYDQLNGYLLILGTAGSGKTFTLIQIAEYLIRRARADPSQPIPVILDLSSWRRGRPFDDWVIAQVSDLYVESKDLVRNWLNERRLILLLDSLDRVGEEDRAACVKDINAFLENSPHGLVVSSRETSYIGLPLYLRLYGAVRLEPLSHQEIINYLTSQDGSVPDLIDSILADPTLFELAETPFGLSILNEAYQDRNIGDLNALTGGSIEQRRRRLFEQYTERMLNLPGSDEFSSKQTIRWLAWLGRGMTDNHIELFWYERLQPSWLQGPPWQTGYLLGSRITFGLFAGLLGGIIIGLGLGITGENLLRGLIEGVTGGLVGGMVVGLLDVAWNQSRVPLFEKFAGHKWRTALYITIVVISTIVFVLAAFLLVLRPVNWCGIIEGFCHWEGVDWLVEGLSVGFLVGLSSGLVFGIELKDGRRRLANDIQAGTVEKMKWSWVRARLFGLYGAIFGALAGFTVAIVHLLLTGVLENPLVYWATEIMGLSGFAAVLAITVLAATICGLAVTIIAGLTGSVIDPHSRTDANQGMRLSFQNAAIVGGATTILWSVVGYFLGSWAFALYGVFIGYLAFMWFGGLNLFLHATMRIFMWHLDYAPRLGKYLTFLNYCVGLRFLQEILGGYQFSHQYWREYFATKEDSANI